MLRAFRVVARSGRRSFDRSDPESQSEIRRALTALDAQLVMYRPMVLDQVIGSGAAQRVFTLRTLMAFAAVALILAALRIFGVLSYSIRSASGSSASG